MKIDKEYIQSDTTKGLVASVTVDGLDFDMKIEALKELKKRGGSYNERVNQLIDLWTIGGRI